MRVAIRELNIYPIKSCAGVSLQRSDISEQGLKWDREWVLVNKQGHKLTQRELPRMVLIQPQISDTHLHLTAPGMAPFRISLDVAVSPAVQVAIWSDTTIGSDEGDAVAAWFSEFLGQSCRLLRVHPNADRKISAERIHTWQRSTGLDSSYLQYSSFGFADGFPFLFCNEASLNAVNETIVRQQGKPITHSRFRPNIVIAGLEAFEEDHILRLDNEQFGFAKLKNCTRCQVPDVEPLTGLVSKQPGRALAKTRHFPEGILFGINAALYKPCQGSIEVGQELQVTLDL